MRLLQMQFVSMFVIWKVSNYYIFGVLFDGNSELAMILHQLYMLKCIEYQNPY